ncbi:hypothetical protein [Pontiella sp.]|uniref:hypothetical protein n=1 Tax=Pontiella sp. TaxID=2837462 RepID=UPI0035617385
MGFWQHLVESYDRNADALQKVYPLSSTTISNSADNIAIVILDGTGKFLDCEVILKRPTGKKRDQVPLVNITVPASEESLKRTSTAILPYPIFEQFDYMEGLVGIRGWEKSYVKKFGRHCEMVRKYIEDLKRKEKAASDGEKKLLKRRSKRWR